MLCACVSGIFEEGGYTADMVECYSRLRRTGVGVAGVRLARANFEP